jgi:hypothetical protein
MSKNPLLQQKYQEGYQEGLRQAKAISAAHMTVKLERLAALSGVGPKTFGKIIQDFMRELTEEEQAAAQVYVEEYLQTKKPRGMD